MGTLLYYARIADPTLLVALSTLATQQTKATTDTMGKLKQLMDYCHTYQNATIRYNRSDMILKVHSDAAYLNEQSSRSRAGGYFYMGNKPDVDNDNNG